MNSSTDPEKAALLHFLDAQRESVVAILEGLDDAALDSVVVPSGWTPIGLVAHLEDAEYHWFQNYVSGNHDDPPWAGRSGDESAEDVIVSYLAQCARSNAVLEATPLSATPLGEHDDPELAAEITDFRRVVLHMIEETARHAGHLDIAREMLDGRTGLGPR